MSEQENSHPADAGKPVASPLPRHILDQLRALDTCTVSNAIERFRVRLRNEGFMRDAAKCMFPRLPATLGYAVTGRIRASDAPAEDQLYYDRLDFWTYCLSIPEPRVIVVEDSDRLTGIGAFIGEIHAHIALALNCVGWVTNGSVRDLPALEEMGFQVFAGSVAVSHSYAHIVSFGDPVQIGSLRIRPGDLIHGDRHGVHTIPLSIAAGIPQKAAEIREQEREFVRVCRAPDFSIQTLARALERIRSDIQPPPDE